MEDLDKSYHPSPISTSEIELPQELLALSENIAKQVHEVWAKNRVNEGWTYGIRRDDAKRQTPCLVPYEMLSEEEKEYDRNTSQETLKLILKLGFEIIKK